MGPVDQFVDEGFNRDDLLDVGVLFEVVDVVLDDGCERGAVGLFHFWIIEFKLIGILLALVSSIVTYYSTNNFYLFLI